MTKFKYIILIMTVTVTIWNCTANIDVDVPYAGPRLIVEASIEWHKNGLGNEQSVQLSILNRFNQIETVIPVLDANVQVVNESNDVTYNFEDQGEGLYTTDEFVPILGDEYRLEIVYEGDHYEAHEVMIGTPNIDEVYQSRDEGFDDDLLEVHVEFKDSMETEDYYLNAFIQADSLLPHYVLSTDQFREGNVFDIIYEKDVLDEGNGFQPGEQIKIRLCGVSKQYHSYLNVLLNNYDRSAAIFGNAYENARGNCINLSNRANFALGYFSLSQIDTASYTFE